jgi:hypothetical protein
MTANPLKMGATSENSFASNVHGTEDNIQYIHSQYCYLLGSLHVVLSHLANVNSSLTVSGKRR